MADGPLLPSRAKIPHPMSDEQVREFHLDGKQLVFLVISGIGIGVVVFLCGVLVGRGVRTPVLAESLDAVATNATDTLEGTDDPTLATAATDATALPDENLTYPERLRGSAPPDSIEDPVPAAEPVPAVKTPPRSEPVATTAKVAPATTAAKGVAATATAKDAVAPAAGEPAGKGYVVQVMSVTKRTEADSVARRLNSRGYQAFVSPTSEGGQRFRVRVGTFATMKDATAALARLKKEEKLKDSWIDRSR